MVGMRWSWIEDKRGLKTNPYHWIGESSLKRDGRPWVVCQGERSGTDHLGRRSFRMMASLDITKRNEATDMMWVKEHLNVGTYIHDG